MTPVTPASPAPLPTEDLNMNEAPYSPGSSVDGTEGNNDTSVSVSEQIQNQNENQKPLFNESLEPNMPILIRKTGPGFNRAHAHEYPLSAVDTPEFLRSFRFNVDGQEAIFREVDLDEDEPGNVTALITAVSEQLESAVGAAGMAMAPSMAPSIGGESKPLKRERDTSSKNPTNTNELHTDFHSECNEDLDDDVVATHAPPLKKLHYADCDVHHDSTPLEEVDNPLASSRVGLDRSDDCSNVHVLASSNVHTHHQNDQTNPLMPPPDVPATPADEDEDENNESHDSPHMNLPSPSISPVTGSRGMIPRIHRSTTRTRHEREHEQGHSHQSVSATAMTTITTTNTASNTGLKANTPLRNIPTVIEHFDQMPDRLKNYVLYNLLRRCNRSSLSFLSQLIVPALRSDFIALLPTELAYKILGYLDVKTLCAAAQVSKVWHDIVDNADWIWKDLLEADDLALEEDELERAKRERWGYTGWNDCPKPPKNIYKAIYRRKLLIRRNWMNPHSKPKHLAVLGHGRDVVTCLQFDDERIITGSDDSTINVYDTKTGKLLHRFEGHDGGVWALKYINKRTLVSGSTDRTVRVWDIEKAKCTHVFYGHTSTVRCLDTVMPVKKIDPVTNQVTYTPPFPIIITGSRDSTLRVWRLPKPDDTPYLPHSAAEAQGSFADPYFLRSLRGHTNSVRALSGYEDTVVSGSYDTTVRVWKISTGKCMWELTGHAQRVYSAVFDHKRNRCISGSMDWFVKVWSIDTGSLLYTLEGHTSLVGLLDLNRTTLVSAAADSTLRVWDPETGANIHKLGGHQGAITCFQHDESKVVSGSDPILKLWNIRTGTLVKNLLTDLNRIWQVCFDQRRCVAAVKRDQKTFIEVLDFDYDPETTTEEDSQRVVISSIDGSRASP